ncbi:hypothetical protein PCAR4_180083 [Paraburkholderia caribensis]|nr:hypothetical protein PCAR4_180083 [Paraburkholderia caribensis]
MTGRKNWNEVDTGRIHREYGAANCPQAASRTKVLQSAERAFAAVSPLSARMGATGLQLASAVMRLL